MSKRWEDMTPEEQNEVYPVWLAAVWCAVIFGLYPAAIIAGIVYLAIVSL